MERLSTCAVLLCCIQLPAIAHAQDEEDLGREAHRVCLGELLDDETRDEPWASRTETSFPAWFEQASAANTELLSVQSFTLLDVKCGATLCRARFETACTTVPEECVPTGELQIFVSSVPYRDCFEGVYSEPYVLPDTLIELYFSRPHGNPFGCRFDELGRPVEVEAIPSYEERVAAAASTAGQGSPQDERDCLLAGLVSEADASDEFRASFEEQLGVVTTRVEGERPTLADAGMVAVLRELRCSRVFCHVVVAVECAAGAACDGATDAAGLAELIAARLRPVEGAFEAWRLPATRDEQTGLAEFFITVGGGSLPFCSAAGEQQR